MLHKHGGDIYTYDTIKDFSANINFLGMPEAVRAAALQAVDRSVYYPDTEYHTLRKALAVRENEWCVQALAIHKNERCAQTLAIHENERCARALAMHENEQCAQTLAMHENERCARTLAIHENERCARTLAIHENEWYTRTSAIQTKCEREPTKCTQETESFEGGIHGRTPWIGSLRKLSPENFICGNGAAELMFALAAAVRPKKALLAVPSFFEYEQALSAYGCRISRYLMKKENDFCLGDSFLEAVDDTVDIVILGNPNNPTGRLVEKGFLDALLEKCQSCQTFLVLDESFFDFLTAEDRRETYSGVTRIAGNKTSAAPLFVLKSFTKMYAMPGLRFGYGISGDTELLYKMRTMMQPWNVSVPAAEAAEAAAEELEFAVETARRTAENRTALKKAMEAFGYHVFPSCTNFLLFEGPRGLKEFCLERGCLIRDCGNFPGLEYGQTVSGRQPMETEPQTADMVPGQLEIPSCGRAYYRICVRSQEENIWLLEILRKAVCGCRE